MGLIRVILPYPEPIGDPIELVPLEYETIEGLQHRIRRQVHLRPGSLVDLERKFDLEWVKQARVLTGHDLAAFPELLRKGCDSVLLRVKEPGGASGGMSRTMIPRSARKAAAAAGAAGGGSRLDRAPFGLGHSGAERQSASGSEAMLLLQEEEEAFSQALAASAQDEADRVARLAAEEDSRMAAAQEASLRLAVEASVEGTWTDWYTG